MILRRRFIISRRLHHFFRLIYLTHNTFTLCYIEMIHPKELGQYWRAFLYQYNYLSQHKNKNQKQNIQWSRNQLNQLNE